MYLGYYGTSDVHHPLPRSLTRKVREGNDQGVGDLSPIVVLDVVSPQSPIDLSQDQKEKYVCALRDGQVLESLIGPKDRGYVCLSAKDVRRWNKVAEVFRRSDIQEMITGCMSRRVKKPNPHLSSLGTDVMILTRSPKLANAYSSLVTHQSNFPQAYISILPRDVLNEVVKNRLLSILLVFLPIAYGGIHLVAWHFDFASHIEHILWKIAAIFVMSMFSTHIPLIHCIDPWIGFRNLRETSHRTLLLRLTRAIFWTPLIAYAFCRIYLVVESFISLRHAPIGVFATIPWTQSLPFI